MACRECNGGVGRRDGARFCSDKCKNKFNNRRLRRGAVLYDLMMTNRLERKRGEDLRLMTIIARLIADWNEEDQRAGIKSYGDVTEWLEKNPWIQADMQGVVLGDGKMPRSQPIGVSAGGR